MMWKHLFGGWQPSNEDTKLLTRFTGELACLLIHKRPYCQVMKRSENKTRFGHSRSQCSVGQLCPLPPRPIWETYLTRAKYLTPKLRLFPKRYLAKNGFWRGCKCFLSNILQMLNGAALKPSIDQLKYKLSKNWFSDIFLKQLHLVWNI